MKAFAKGKSVWKGNGRLLEAFSKLFPHNIIVRATSEPATKNLRASNMVTGHIHRNIYTHSIHLLIGRCDMADRDDEIASAVHLL